MKSRNIRKKQILSILLVGLVLVNLLWSPPASGLSAWIGRFIFPIAILLLVLFWRRLETKSHKRNLQDWLRRRRQGRLRFVLLQYLLLRGGTLFVVLVLAFYASVGLSALAFIVLLSSFVPIFLILFWMGREEWKTWEEEFEILALRHAAEESRRFSALTN